MPAPTSASGAAEPGPPRTELQELQFKAGQTTDEVRACEGGLPSLPPSRALAKISRPTYDIGCSFVSSGPSVLALGSGPRFWPSVLALGSGPRFWPAVLARGSGIQGDQVPDLFPRCVSDNCIKRPDNYCVNCFERTAHHSAARLLKLRSTLRHFFV
jgi:hypothetical protein